MEDGIAVLHKQAWGRKDSLLIIRATWDTAQRRLISIFAFRRWEVDTFM